MKKIVTIMCMILTICIISNFTFEVQATSLKSFSTVTFSTSGNLQVNSTFTIKVNVSNVQDLYGASLDFKYDPTLIKIEDISNGDIFSSNVKIPVKKNESGLASIAITQIGAIAGVNKTSGTLVNIKVKALKEGTLNLKPIFDNSSLSNNGNNVRIKLSNSNAQKISSTGTASIVNIKKVETALTTLKAGTYEDNNSGLRYTGNWSSLSNTNFSGGTVKLSETKGNTVEFKFNGTGFEWYGHTNEWRGKAKVYIDGTAVATVDSYSATDVYKKLLYSKTGLTAGDHTVKIEVLGEKSAESSSTKVTVDKIVIKNDLPALTTLKAGTYEDNNSGLRYTGNWSSLSNTNFSGGTVKLSETKGNTVEFKFNGTGFEWYGHTNEWRGKAKVYIDGTAVATVDSYSATDVYKKLLYSKTGLTAGDHTVKIEVLGEKSAESSSTKVTVDKIVIKNDLVLSTGTYEETNSAFKYTGSWSNLSNTNFSGGTVKLSETKGNTVEFKFNGTGFEWYGHTNEWRGKAKVYIDGTAVATVDSYSATDVYKKLLYSKTGLTAGDHTVKIEVLGEKSAESSSTKVTVDKIVIKNDLPALTTLKAGTYEDNNSGLRYTGNWSSLSNTNFSGGTVKLSETKGNTVEFKFNGTGFEWYGHTNEWRGKAKVYIDGTAVATVDSYSATDVYKKLLYSKTGLTAGDHTVKIEVLGEKSAESSSTKVTVDKIVIKNDLPALTTLKAGTYEDNNSGLRYTGNWSSLSNTNFSGGTVKLSETKGNTVEFKFNGTGFEWYGHTNEWRGKAKVYIDGTAVATVDSYSATDVYKKLLYSKTGLTAGDHTVKIEVLGEKSAESSSTKVTVDKIVIKNDLVLSTGTYEETNSAFKYTGSWSNLSNTNFSGGTVKLSEAKGNTVEFKFNGTGFEWYGHANEWRGKAKVYIDGVAVATVDSYSATDVYKKLLYSKTGLKAGEHTVKIEVLGEKSSGASSAKVTIDKIVINPTTSYRNDNEASSTSEENKKIEITPSITEGGIDTNTSVNIIEDENSSYEIIGDYESEETNDEINLDSSVNNESNNNDSDEESQENVSEVEEANLSDENKVE